MAFINPITPGALASTLNSLVNTTAGAGGSSQADEPRSALVFTSDLRRRLLENATTSLSANNFAFNLNRFAGDDPALSSAGVLANQQASAIEAASNDVSDVSNQLVRALPSIVMELNPKSIEFDQPKRFARQDTQKGTVFHHFTNDKGQNNDILTIRFGGNTGNIWRRAREQVDQDKAIQRLKIWHNLYQLTREPMLLTDGSANVFYITYVSPLFPVPIEFQGFFTSVLKFSENGEKPNSRDYSMEFIVRNTSPDLNVIAAQVLDFVSQEALAIPTRTSRVLTQG